MLRLEKGTQTKHRQRVINFSYVAILLLYGKIRFAHFLKIPFVGCLRKFV